jgi:hypothetical protein
MARPAIAKHLWAERISHYPPPPQASPKASEPPAIDLSKIPQRKGLLSRHLGLLSQNQPNDQFLGLSGSYYQDYLSHRQHTIHVAFYVQQVANDDIIFQHVVKVILLNF